MSRQIRRTEIRIETHEIEVVRLQKRQVLALCERCREIVTATTPELLAELLEKTQEEGSCHVEAERVSHNAA